MGMRILSGALLFELQKAYGKAASVYRGCKYGGTPYKRVQITLLVSIWRGDSSLWYEEYTGCLDIVLFGQYEVLPANVTRTLKEREASHQDCN